MESLVEALVVGPIASLRGWLDRAAMHLLEPVQQHGAVDLVQQPLIYAHFAVARNPQKITVVRRVVDLAEAQAVWNYGVSLIVPIANDVRGIQ